MRRWNLRQHFGPLLFWKAKVQSGLHWRRRWRQVAILVSPCLKAVLVFLPKSCRTGRNAVRSMLKQVRSNSFTILPWSKMSRRRSRLDFSMNFAWLRIHKEWISQIGFAAIVFHVGVRNIIASGGGGRCDLLWGKPRWALMNSVASSGTRGGGSGFRCWKRWRWDKQCQRPSKHPVNHASVWIIQERLPLSTCSVDTSLRVRPGG